MKKIVTLFSIVFFCSFSSIALAYTRAPSGSSFSTIDPVSVSFVPGDISFVSGNHSIDLVFTGTGAPVHGACQSIGPGTTSYVGSLSGPLPLGTLPADTYTDVSVNIYLASGCTGTFSGGSYESGSPLFTVAVAGCTDPSATNYDSSATVDDGSCVYPVGVAPDCPSGTSDDFCAAYSIFTWYGTKIVFGVILLVGLLALSVRLSDEALK